MRINVRRAKTGIKSRQANALKSVPATRKTPAIICNIFRVYAMKMPLIIDVPIERTQAVVLVMIRCKTDVLYAIPIIP